jgi:hypothetical protein
MSREKTVRAGCGGYAAASRAARDAGCIEAMMRNSGHSGAVQTFSVNKTETVRIFSGRP